MAKLRSMVDDTGWVRVKSTNVKRIRHLGAPVNELYVQFKNGGGMYTNVPRSVFRRMVNAVSKGKFVHRVLKDQYPWFPGRTI